MLRAWPGTRRIKPRRSSVNTIECAAYLRLPECGRSPRRATTHLGRAISRARFDRFALVLLNHAVRMRPGEFFSRIASWSDFCGGAAAQNEGTRGSLFELVVRHYLTTDPIYCAKLAHVWLRADVPPEIQLRLRLPPRDMGIDLVAETHAGDFWAVQAKYRTDADAALTFSELSTFASLAFTVCDGFGYALVCTTTSRIPGILTGLPRATIYLLAAETICPSSMHANSFSRWESNRARSGSLTSILTSPSETQTLRVCL